ncbi:hypothetical protein [Candidatus Albibeggiatoa sp. nov. NOAA]|uniref:hypothetical protein n=1 Tax=Candidatus Albibeggiatoa sp. nov. NOAA TaxID=3162724 RepID=UPI0032F48D06|nr:hypothetical protein [Thiotrichaceae bacterium]
MSILSKGIKNAVKWVSQTPEYYDVYAYNKTNKVIQVFTHYSPAGLEETTRVCEILPNEEAHILGPKGDRTRQTKCSLIFFHVCDSNNRILYSGDFYHKGLDIGFFGCDMGDDMNFGKCLVIKNNEYFMAEMLGPFWKTYYGL